MRIGFTVICFLGIASISFAQSAMSADLQGIEETRAGFISAIDEGRYQGLANYTTPDINMVPPGSQDWLAMYRLSGERGAFPYDSIRMTPVETVIVSDDTAYDFGHSKVYYTDEDGNVVKLQNSYLAILKKDTSGKWRLHREVASATVPPAASGAGARE